MSNFDGVLNPAAGWPDIPQASTSMVVLGGAGGPLNEQATQLAARTKKLKEDIENISPVGFGGQYKNLVVTVSGVGYQGAITADGIVVESSDYKTSVIRGLNVSFNGATAGAGGLDTGVIAANTWYYIHVVYNPTSKTSTALLSLSATAPSLPAGYTQWARVGAAYSLASAFRNSIQRNSVCKWRATSPDLSDTFNTSSTTLVEVPLGNRMPSTAKIISFINVAASGSAQVALTGSSGVIQSSVYGSFYETDVLTMSNSIFYKCTSGITSTLYFTGYIDTL